jgi:hypothetical protein
MNEEIFDSISDLLAKSGTTVSNKLDGSIVVSLPDSSEKLADCTDNGDGTVSYTMYRGDDTEEVGSGTPEEFKEHVLDALDSWIDYVPYDQFAVEPNVSVEYRRAIGESRDDAMRRSLFEMGLDYNQAEAIIGVANALMESGEYVSVNVDGKTMEGSSFENLVSRNEPYLTRKWLLKQIREKNVDVQGMDLKMSGISALTEKIWQHDHPGEDLSALSPAEKTAELNKVKPTKAQLKEYVEQYRSAAQTQTFQTDDDVLGNNFDKRTKEKDTSKDTALRAAVSGNEDAIQSGEADDYDDEIEGHVGHLAANYTEDGRKISGSDEEASAEIGASVKEIKDQDSNTKTDAQQRIIKMLGDRGYKYPELGTLPIKTLEQCLFAINKLTAKKKFNLDTDAELEPGKLLHKAGYTKDNGPSDEDVRDEMMKTLWVGDVNSLNSKEPYEIPTDFIAMIEENAETLKNSFDEYLAIIPRLPRGTATRYVMDLLFGAPGNGVGGIVGGILNGDQTIMDKIAKGESLIDGSSMTPAQYNGISQALKNEVLSSAIRAVQDNLGNYIDIIVSGLPGAFDEACNDNVSDYTYAAIDPEFVTMIRSILFGKQCPLAGYPWNAIDTLINDIGKVMTVSAPSGAQRKITGTVPGKTIKSKKPEGQS